MKLLPLREVVIPHCTSIKQWGRLTINKSRRTINFPTAFPSSCYAVINGEATIDVSYGGLCESITTTGFTMNFSGKEHSSQTAIFSWVAIGK